MSHDMLLRAKTWRIIVNLSKRSPLFFAVFGGACTAGTYYLATATQKGTNPTDKDALFIEEDQLKRNAGLHAKVIARANKERLRVLLEEARDKKGDNERYKAALNGESLGTHSTGTTSGAAAITVEEKENKTSKRGWFFCGDSGVVGVDAPAEDNNESFSGDA